MGFDQFNAQLGVTLWWTKVPSRGSINAPSRFTLKETKINSSFIFYRVVPENIHAPLEGMFHLTPLPSEKFCGMDTWNHTHCTYKIVSMVKARMQNTHLSNIAWFCRHVSKARTKEWTKDGGPTT